LLEKGDRTMIRTGTLLLAVMLAGGITAAYAATYTWTDEQGTVHFSEDPGSVPAKLRNKVRILEEYEPAASTAVSPDKAVDREQQGVPRAAGDKAESMDGGKSLEQWKKELVALETAMYAVSKRIDDVAAALKSYGSQMYRQENLLTEYNALLAQFKGMQTEYYQQVEIARKAGLKINIQQ
jgi:hypothetical protein